jgi:hypothetical protein
MCGAVCALVQRLLQWVQPVLQFRSMRLQNPQHRLDFLNVCHFVRVRIDNLFRVLFVGCQAVAADIFIHLVVACKSQSFS